MLNSKNKYLNLLNQEYGASVVPIFQIAAFNQNDKGYFYSRITNPTIEATEDVLAQLEKGDGALCFSSGMGAIAAAVFYWISQGSHIVCVKNACRPTKHFLSGYLQKFGVTVSYVDGTDLDEMEQAIRKNTSLIYLESPTSSIFLLQDLQAVAKLARSYNIPTIIDNTWATPIFQNPLEFGIDMVVHSCSKYLNGHEDIVGGVLIGAKEHLETIVERERALIGACMDPHQSWLLLRGLRTLDIRMKQHQESALKIAKFLNEHPLVEHVHYPGLPNHPQYELGKKQMSGYSGLMSFVPKGSTANAMNILHQLNVFKRIPEGWGGFDSTVAMPGYKYDKEEAKELGFSRKLINISIGLEDVESLINDLDQALKA